MTSQIIDYYEKLDVLTSDVTRKGELTYSASCLELNELQNTFNKVFKVCNIANDSVKEGSEYRAMLDYAEAYHIFKEFDNQPNMYTCLSNMGAIKFSM